MNWQGQLLQVVWFSARAQEADAEAVYSAVFGVEPADIHRSRVITPKAPFFSTAQSDFGGGVGKVTVQPGRVDLYVQPREDPEAPVPFAVIPEWETSYAALKKGVLASSNIVPDVARLAVVANLLAPGDSAEQVTEFVASAAELPYHRGTGYSDVMLQLNRRLSSKAIDGLDINRLLRLMSLKAQAAFLLSDISASGASSMVDVADAGSWMIDINSVPMPAPFSNEQQHAIFSEMFDESDRIRTSGSIKALQG